MIVALLLAVAAAQGAAKSTPRPTPAAAARASAPAPRSDVRTVVGQIVSIDAAKGTMTIGESLQTSRPKTSKLKESVTLSIDASTQVFRGKRAATKDDLHQLDHVVVRYVVTPQGARALSCRASDTVALYPSPTAAPSAPNVTASASGSASDAR